MTELNARQQKFVLEYLKTGNGKQSAIAAGYSEKSAESQAVTLLKDPKVSQVLKEKQGKLMNKLEISVERVLKERARLAFFDPRKFFDKDGNPIPIHELDDDTAAVVAGLEVKEESDHEGNPTGYTKKIKLADKDKSLTALEKNLGMYKEEKESAPVFNIYLHL